MIKVVGIKFKNGNKLYYFSPKAGDVYERNMPVIVETSRGIEYAWVAYPEKLVPDDEVVPPLKPIIRIATNEDTRIFNSYEEKKPQAMQVCKEKIEKHGLSMKLIDCEYCFDGSKVVFYFTSGSRVDFRELVKDLASALHMRIELRQIGTRDEAKYLGGIAPCGRVCCCAGSMPEFKKVSVRMAKTQGLSLNPGKISGLCGRLMCCLSYENDYYAEVNKLVPKVGSEVGTPEGKGIVVTNNMLKLETTVKIEDKDGSLTYKTFPVDTLQFKRKTAPEKEEQEGDDDDVLPEE
ncbi:MAG: stage 0 sporulation family protein [Clostridia bacterium]|nr:stage 0 sporulation family protein [Clostridia bacterium]